MRPPNLLFLISDQQRADTAEPDTLCQMPNLDSLAAAGTRFNRCYTVNPICSPTRASIMSGKYPARVGVTQFIGGHNEGKLADVPYLHYLPLEEVSVATVLRDGGYQTWHVGKWHLGDEDFYPDRHGFDVNVGGCHWGMPAQDTSAPRALPRWLTALKAST